MTVWLRARRLSSSSDDWSQNITLCNRNLLLQVNIASYATTPTTHVITFSFVNLFTIVTVCSIYHREASKLCFAHWKCSPQSRNKTLLIIFKRNLNWKLHPILAESYRLNTFFFWKFCQSFIFYFVFPSFSILIQFVVRGSCAPSLRPIIYRITWLSFKSLVKVTLMCHHKSMVAAQNSVSTFNSHF